MRFRSLENANPISSVFNFRIRFRQPEAQGAVFFLTLLEKTIPTSTETGLEPNRAGITQIASKMRFRSLPKMHVRSHPQQPKPSGKHTNTVKNAFPKPTKKALPKPSTATQTEWEARKKRKKYVSEAYKNALPKPPAATQTEREARK